MEVIIVKQFKGSISRIYDRYIGIQVCQFAGGFISKDNVVIPFFELFRKNPAIYFLNYNAVINVIFFIEKIC